MRSRRAQRRTTVDRTELHDILVRHVDRGELPGLVALVADHDGTPPHVEAIGAKAFGDTEPIGRDAIFRIASLTKPVTAAVTMALVEDGTVDLDEPVQRWLPELADRRVLRRIDGPLDDTVPAHRPITVADVLTFRLGFGLVMDASGTPVQQAEEALVLRTLGPPWPPTHHTPDSWIAAFATLPLMDQPGDVWRYNTGSQVLGVLLERASGRPLEALYRERLLDPLGMADTSFHVAADKVDRFTTAYRPEAEGSVAVQDPVRGWWSVSPSFPDASAWLVSTVDDYWRFASMLVAGGGDVLSPESVRMMTTDHLTPAQRAGGPPILEPGAGWGFGVQVAADGTYGWNGGSGTMWRTSPGLGRTGILFTQRAMTSPDDDTIFADFARAAFSTT